MVPNAPAAGVFNLESEFQFRCTVRKGDIRDNPRGGTVTEFKAKISEGLSVTKAKALSFVRREMSSAQLISDDLYFKKSKGAAQSQFIKLTDENFEEKTRVRWALISSRDVNAWAEADKSVLEGFFFEIFLYIQRRRVDNVPRGLRRATQTRIEAASQQIRGFEEANNTELGPITRHHLSIHQARQPEGSQFTTIPNDNTTRQAQFLDEQRQLVAARREEGGGEANDDTRNRKKIRIEVHGTWVDVFVDIRSLRSALGLPDHDIFDRGIFLEYQHHETTGQDVEDTDHQTNNNNENINELET